MELLGGFPSYGDKLRLRNAACQNKKPPCRVVSVLELLGGFEPPTSSLPSDKKPSGRWYIRLCGRFYRKKDEAGNSLLHVFRPLVSPCGSRCGSAPQAAPVWVNFAGRGMVTFCAAGNNKKIPKRRNRATRRSAMLPPGGSVASQCVSRMGQNVGQSFFNSSRKAGNTS